MAAGVAGRERQTRSVRRQRARVLSGVSGRGRAIVTDRIKGHMLTLVVDGEVFKLQLTPSGVLYPWVVPIIGNGVVIDPAVFKKEVDALIETGLKKDEAIFLGREFAQALVRRSLERFRLPYITITPTFSILE